jgi:hypothetical protein
MFDKLKLRREAFLNILISYITNGAGIINRNKNPIKNQNIKDKIQHILDNKLIFINKIKLTIIFKHK